MTATAEAVHATTTAITAPVRSRFPRRDGGFIRRN
jgi:hypothetical protein